MAIKEGDIAKQKPSKYQMLSQKYHYVKDNYLKFLPRSPISRLLIAFHPIKWNLNVFKGSNRQVISELYYRRKNFSRLEDVQREADLDHFLKFLIKTELIDGDILELGVYKGGTTTLFAHFLKKINSKKKIFACDTFTGLPYDDEFSGYKDGKFKGWLSDTSYEYVIKKFQEFEVDDKIIAIEGIFEKVVPQKLANEKFSFVLFDFDLYQSTMHALNFVYSRVPKNGIMVFQNYERINKDNPEWGETKAVDEFFGAMGMKIDEKPIPHFIKK